MTPRPCILCREAPALVIDGVQTLHCAGCLDLDDIPLDDDAIDALGDILADLAAEELAEEAATRPETARQGAATVLG